MGEAYPTTDVASASRAAVAAFIVLLCGGCSPPQDLAIRDARQGKIDFMAELDALGGMPATAARSERVGAF